ncbi:putative F-box protein [Sesamum alatum]|uniref:F-box protein n=1 Tax=Sesamum alatum TaxID=300844 RepID=A0AAE1YHW0_9LAMI|nr:putative F-box protein [Sesamum alatum]
MSTVVNKIQPSQLVEEQRNAARLFKQFQSQIETTLSIGKPTAFDVREMMDKVLALNKAYPLPLLRAMLEKFPDTVEQRRKQPRSGNDQCYNGWDGKLEVEMREVGWKSIKTEQISCRR